MIPLDLSDTTSVDDFASEVLDMCSESGLDGLVNNAAMIECDGEIHSTGLELVFVTNALGPFQLTQRLIPKLKEKSSRIVTVGSRLESQGMVDPVALESHGRMWQPENGLCTGMKAYASTKLCNQLMNLELHRRLKEDGVTSVCVSPGLVDTGLWRHYPLWYQIVTLPFRKAYLRTPREAAAGVIFCLISPQIATYHAGSFMYDGKPIEPCVTAQDPQLASALWHVSEKLVQRARLHNQLGLWRD